MNAAYEPCGLENYQMKHTLNITSHVITDIPSSVDGLCDGPTDRPCDTAVSSSIVVKLTADETTCTSVDNKWSSNADEVPSSTAEKCLPPLLIKWFPLLLMKSFLPPLIKCFPILHYAPAQKGLSACHLYLTILHFHSILQFHSIPCQFHYNIVIITLNWIYVCHLLEISSFIILNASLSLL